MRYVPRSSATDTAPGAQSAGTDRDDLSSRGLSAASRSAPSGAPHPTDRMDDKNPPKGSADAAPRWTAPPTLKERTAVQRSVDRLLDELAPERAVTRGDRPKTPIERHRTPRGCILQAAAGAVSVTWFPDADNDVALGELQVVAWRGVLSRPGSVDRSEGAVVVKELVLRPIEEAPAARGTSVWAWRALDGTTYDAAALVAHCLALLELQMDGGNA